MIASVAPVPIREGVDRLVTDVNLAAGLSSPSMFSNPVQPILKFDGLVLDTGRAK